MIEDFILVEGGFSLIFIAFVFLGVYSYILDKRLEKRLKKEKELVFHKLIFLSFDYLLSFIIGACISQVNIPLAISTTILLCILSTLIVINSGSVYD